MPHRHFLRQLFLPLPWSYLSLFFSQVHSSPVIFFSVPRSFYAASTLGLLYKVPPIGILLLAAWHILFRLLHLLQGDYRQVSSSLWASIPNPLSESQNNNHSFLKGLLCGLTELTYGKHLARQHSKCSMLVLHVMKSLSFQKLMLQVYCIQMNGESWKGMAAEWKSNQEQQANTGVRLAESNSLCEYTQWELR